MKQRITAKELEEKAASVGLSIQHDCGGYRVVLGGRYLYPDTGICPTATKRDCMVFLMGVCVGKWM